MKFYNNNGMLSLQQANFIVESGILLHHFSKKISPCLRLFFWNIKKKELLSWKVLQNIPENEYQRIHIMFENFVFT